MSLRLDDVGPSDGAICALDVKEEATGQGKIVVGYAPGEFRVYDGPTLERKVHLGRSVTNLVHIPESFLIAAICDRHCSVHNIAMRRVVCQVDSRSAKFLATTTGAQSTRILVVGSSFKIRTMQFRNAQLVNSSVVDSPGSQKVRCLGRADRDGVFVLLGNQPVVLWRLDLITLAWKPLLALDSAVFVKGAHRFVLAGTAHSLFIGCSSGAQLLRLNPLKVVKSWHQEFLNATVLISVPLDLPLIAAQTSKLLLINPTTGSVLDEKADVQLMGTFGLSGSRLMRVRAQLSIGQIVKFQSPSEAASLAFLLKADCITEDLRAIERSEAATLFQNGDIDEAMRLFLQVEEQDNALTTHPFVVSLLKPYLASLAISEQQSRTPDKVHSSQHSLSSTKTSRSAPKHFLDPVVAYLLFTRRKLRLAQFKGPALSDLDTALLRCYMVMGSALVVPLLRSTNQCDPEVARELLISTGKWRELVWFFRSREHHREALNLLVEHSEPPESIVAYLESLPGPLDSWLDLVFEYAKNPLVQNHTLAHRLFFEENHMDSARVFSYLSNIDANLGQSFAEFRVTQFGDETTALHNAVASCWAKVPEKQNQMLQFITESRFIDAKELIADSNISRRGIAILHERLGQYEKAVEVLLTECDDLDAALAAAERRNISTFLFEKLILNSSTPQGLTALLKFLSQASPFADLELGPALVGLPDSIKLGSVTKFLRTFMANGFFREKNSALAEAVTRLALTELSLQITEFRKQKFTVNSTDACCLCHKKLGKAVTGVVDGSLAHYACLKML